MSRTLEQIFTDNPITTNQSLDLMYFARSPYSPGNDAGMTFANFAAQFGAPFTPSALTATPDTNVTITLGGSPSTALLHAASITLGWTGTLSPIRGGTGINNGSNTLTLGGSLATIGAFSSNFTMTGATNVTFPTSGTLATTSQLPTGAALTEVNDTNVTLTLGGSPTTALLNATSLTLGWTGTLSPTRGGTGVNNGSSTLTLGGNLTTSGAFASTFTMTGATNVTFPVSGTLATTATTVSSVSGTANQIGSTGGTTPVISIASNAILPGTGGVTLPTGNTAQRAGIAGTMRFNSQTSVFEATVDGSTWATIETSAIGVTSITGTANQVIASSPTGAVTLSLPQSIATTSNVQFGQVKFAGLFSDANGHGIFAADNAVTFPVFISGGTSVNWVGVVAAPTATNPQFLCGGSDTNVGLQISCQAAGQFVVNTTSNSPLVLKSGTSSQHTSIFTAANTAASQTYTLPDATGTVLITGTAINSVPSITFSSTSGIIGTTTNNNAATGSVGEFLSSVISFASRVNIVSFGTPQNVTSITLGAGDWDVWGNIFFQVGTGTSNGVNAWSSTTSVTLPDQSLFNGISNVTGPMGFQIPYSRYSFASPTTVYLSGEVATGTGSWSFCGGIFARRVR